MKRRRGIVIVLLLSVNTAYGLDLSAMWNLGTISLDITPVNTSQLFEWDLSLFNLTLYDYYGNWGLSTAFFKTRSERGDSYVTLFPLEISFSSYYNRKFKRPLQAFLLAELDVGPKILPYLKAGVRVQVQSLIDYSYAPKAGLELSFDTMLRFRITVYADLGAAAYFFFKRQRRDLEEQIPEGYLRS
ncbi:hypothetical protein [Breznakiella homolactica]|uniref:Uncharacterized protein n=1 Tax=Breznakiella homolactica TaxID=2798577 RepID=A0A7T8BBF2_9SPIR|nr:hypothetical protein [Breznakiella homolactica]QQO10341.1 hypothetical protein JFL75_05325 [Breznakiella homolactica]